MLIDNLNSEQQVDAPQYLSAQELIQSDQGGAPGTEDQVPVAEEIAGIPKDQFYNALRAEFGEDATVEALKSSRKDAGRASQLEQKIREYEANAKISPYANPAVERINNLMKEGKGIQDVAKYLELSSLDLTTMQPIEAIRRHYALNQPGIPAELIDGLIENDLGFDPSDPEAELTSAQKASLWKKQQDAVSFLKDQQLSADNPQAVQAAQEQQQIAQRNVQTWSEVIPTMKLDQKFEFQVNDQVIELQYQPSAGAVEQARQMAIATIAGNPLAFPATREQSPIIKDMIDKFLLITDAEKIKDAIFKHAYATATEEVTQRLSGNKAALNRPQPQQQQIPGQNKPATNLADYIR